MVCCHAPRTVAKAAGASRVQHLELSVVGHGHAVGGEGHVVGISQVSNQVLDGALASGLVLGNEANQGNHGQAAVPDLVDLVGGILLGLRQTQGIEQTTCASHENMEIRTFAPYRHQKQHHSDAPWSVSEQRLDPSCSWHGLFP